MVKMVIDSTLRAKLQDAREVELCDETGRTLGRFLSEDAYRGLISELAGADIPEEEVQRLLGEPGGRTLAEIWADLERT